MSSIFWCYSDSTPYDIETLYEEFQTGCPYCGDECWVNISDEQKQEAEEYFAEMEDESKCDDK
jgi:hypothetical protein